MRGHSAIRMAAGVFTTLAALCFIAGCAPTSGGTRAGENPGSAPTVQTAGESGLKKAPDFPPGKFTVQLGAYTSEEAAMKIAVLARSRFTREVNTVYDAADGLFKVILGIFDTKDEARTFRDTIVRQYPEEYKDAWVSDLVK